MPTKILLAICLSTLVSCRTSTFADKPPGWNCTYKYDRVNSPLVLVYKLRQAQTISEIDEITGAIRALKPDTTGFYCNDIKDPKKTKSFNVADPEINKAQAMPLATAEAYQKYLRDKITELENRCN